MGRNHSDHVRPVRQCLGRQTRNRDGPLHRYHPSGRPSVDPLPHIFFLLVRQIALFVIGVAGIFRSALHSHLDSYAMWVLGFGRRVTWTSDLIVPPGHLMTFKDALHILSSNLILKISLPGWTTNLTERTRKIELAFNELKVPCLSRYLFSYYS